MSFARVAVPGDHVTPETFCTELPSPVARYRQQVAGAGADMDAGSLRSATRPSPSDGSVCTTARPPFRWRLCPPGDGARDAEDIKPDGLRNAGIPIMHSDANTRPYIEALARDALQRFDDIATGASNVLRAPLGSNDVLVVPNPKGQIALGRHRHELREEYRRLQKEPAIAPSSCCR